MQMRPELQINSMIKAMTDVVIPAVSSDNKLALEQSQLIVAMLRLMAKQLPVQFQFDRDELRRLLATAIQLRDIPVDGNATVEAAKEGLAEHCAAAADTLDQCQLDPSALIIANRELREAIGTLVSAIAATVDTAAQYDVETAVLGMSKEQLLRDRSLMLPQGWEPDSTAVPDIETLLDLRS
jgi:hypothetical protein